MSSHSPSPDNIKSPQKTSSISAKGVRNTAVHSMKISTEQKDKIPFNRENSITTILLSRKNSVEDISSSRKNSLEDIPSSRKNSITTILLSRKNSIDNNTLDREQSIIHSEEEISPQDLNIHPLDHQIIKNSLGTHNVGDQIDKKDLNMNNRIIVTQQAPEIPLYSKLNRKEKIRKKKRRSAEKAKYVFTDFLSDLEIVDLYENYSFVFPSVLYDNYDFEVENRLLAEIK